MGFRVLITLYFARGQHQSITLLPSVHNIAAPIYAHKTHPLFPSHKITDGHVTFLSPHSITSP